MTQINPCTAIVADSAIGVRPDEAKALGLVVVPFQLIVDGKAIRDGIDMTSEEFFTRLNSYEELPTTSAPSPGEYMNAFSALWDAGSEIVVITCAKTMTASHKAALLAAQDAGQTTIVVDSRQASAGELLVATAALGASRADMSVTQIADIAGQVADRVRLLGIIDTFEFLKRSGRVSALEAFAAGALGIKPIFEMRGGGADSYAKARGRDGALRRIVVDLHADAESHAGERLHLGLMHAACPDDAAALADSLSDLEPVESVTTEFTPVMGVHTGPGLVGVAWWWEPASGLVPGTG